MAKLTLNQVTTSNQISVINSNFDKLEAELQNKVLYRDNPIGESNPLITDVDVNQKRLINLPEPVLSHQAARLRDVQNAVSGATAANLISFTPYGSVSSDTVQGAIQELADEAAGGGGLGSVGGAVIPSFSIDQTTPLDAVVISDTFPSGFNVGAGRCSLSFNFRSNDYFAANPTGHIGIVTRANVSTIPVTAVEGTGVWIGNLVGVLNGNDYAPSMGIETWANGVMPLDNYLFRYSGSPRNIVMRDNQDYRITVESTVLPNADRFVRYRLYEREAVSEYWKLLNDTGDVLDHNRWADFTNSGLIFGHVFGSNLVPWSLDFTDIEVTWYAALESSADTTSKLSRFGADVEGDLGLYGLGRRIKIYSTTATLPNWTAFQNQTANTATGVMAIPNGTANTANYTVLNTSNPSTSYRAVTYGISGNDGVIETFNLGQADPTVKVNIGPANTVATFKTTGVNVKGAARDLGQPISSFFNYTNWGGTNAKGFTDFGSLNVDALCASGAIASVMSASPSNGEVETVVRPLYCIISTLIKELIDKKVI